MVFVVFSCGCLIVAWLLCAMMLVKPCLIAVNDDHEFEMPCCLNPKGFFEPRNLKRDWPCYCSIGNWPITTFRGHALSCVVLLNEGGIYQYATRSTMFDLPSMSFVHVCFQISLNFKISFLIQFNSKNHGIFCIMTCWMSSILPWFLIFFLIIEY
jgi:hypothetical protein